MQPRNLIERIVIPASHFEEMREFAASKLPEEACGILVGKFENQTACVEHNFPMTNILHSTTRYQLDPAEQIKVFCWMEANQLELVAIYHSHPHGPSYPSDADQAEAFYREACYLIWSNSENKWGCRAYIFEKESYREIQIQHQNLCNE